MANYDVKSIKIKIIRLERIFVDKVFAAEFYYIREKYIDTAKHIYDLCVLIDNEKIRELFYNKEELRRLVEYKREEEKLRTEGISEAVKIKDFLYLKCDFNNEFINGLKEMQDKYITNDEYKIDMSKVMHTLKIIKSKFNEIVI